MGTQRVCPRSLLKVKMVLTLFPLQMAGLVPLENRVPLHDDLLEE